MTEAEKNRKLTELRDKYAKLDDTKKVLAHMQSLCSNTEYLLLCLNSSVQAIRSITSNFTIEGYKELFDKAFGPFETTGSYNSGLNSDIGEFKALLPGAGHKLDEEMDKVAHQIDSTKNASTTG